MLIATTKGLKRLSSTRVRVGITLGAVLAPLIATAAMVPSAARSNQSVAALPLRHAAQAPSAKRTEPSRANAESAEPGTRRFSGRVGADLSKALLAAGIPVPQARDYVALLSRAIDLRDGISVDDRFDLILEQRSDGALGQLLYAGMDRVARADVELLKWTDGKNIIWANADGAGGESREGIEMPIKGRLTSGFGSRFHPILGYRRFHAGLDLAAASGTPIVAAAPGRVVSAGWRGGYGQAVEIAHGDGVDSLYGHMSRITAGAGAVVQRGQVIGYVGSTGLSTGPHLHFEVTRNGRPVDPRSLKLDSGVGQMQGAQLAAFKNELRQILLASMPTG